MAAPSEKLVQSLEILHELQKRGFVAIQSSDISRVHRERLLKNGFIQQVIKGWYIPTNPGEKAGDSTAWYTSFWNFCAYYLTQRFAEEWCLSPEQSILLHAGNKTIPKQLLVRTPKGNNKLTQLPFNTSLFDVRYKVPAPKDMETIDGLRVYSIIPALIACNANFFIQYPTEARAILSTQDDSSTILSYLLKGGHSKISGRLIGALKNADKERIAKEILDAMSAAGYKISIDDPFIEKKKIILSSREKSPRINRLKIMWHDMRHSVISNFPEPPGTPKNSKTYLKTVDEKYVNDAYHSLSIEGYRVNRELIERVRSGSWSPDNHPGDINHKNALAARGYWQAFQAVKKSIEAVLNGNNPGETVDLNHRHWYQEMFSPSIAAGILEPKYLAGYRNGPVYIRQSMHVPPSTKTVRELIPVFFELLSSENNAAVRVVLGHFFFVYIHPYMDGNGRMGRFLMNVMLASGGYPWTIIPVENRMQYMGSLEAASVQQNITPFCKFIAGLIE